MSLVMWYILMETKGKAWKVLHVFDVRAQLMTVQRGCVAGELLEKLHLYNLLR